MVTETSLLGRVEAELTGHGFASRSIAPSLDNVDIAAVWARKTFNTNRAAVALRLPDGVHPGPLSQRLKFSLGRQIGYFPFLYGLGLQLIWIGTNVTPLSPPLDRFIDRIDNQCSIVQSLFVVDLVQGTTRSARTWGQVVTGMFQAAIEKGLRDGLALGG